MAEMRVCPNDSEPVIFTTKYPGHEYVCLGCGWLGGVLGTPTAPVTPELVAKADARQAEFDAEHGLRAPRQDVPRPTCNGCGVEAEGRLDHSGKPAHWFSRTRDGRTEYACSRDCIPARELVLPW